MEVVSNHPGGSLVRRFVHAPSPDQGIWSECLIQSVSTGIKPARDSFIEDAVIDLVWLRPEGTSGIVPAQVLNRRRFHFSEIRQRISADGDIAKPAR